MSSSITPGLTLRSARGAVSSGGYKSISLSARLAEGSIFAGRYRVVRIIASGAMGAVYETVHIETGRRRALKIMHPHLFQSDELCERFKREARIAADVESEFIVDVSDAGVDDTTGMPFLVMEYLRGEELGQRIKRLGRLEQGDVLIYLKQAAVALDRTHAASIVHRDLKPANLFLTYREDGSPRIKILDFGVAKLIAESATSAGATQSLGTPLYMAPEQFRTGSKLTPAADIYALGMTAYTLLVGEPYWKQEVENANDVIAFALTAMQGPQESAVRRASMCGKVLPKSFDRWFSCATALDPADRFASASQAVEALRQVLQGATSSRLSAIAMCHRSMPLDSNLTMKSPVAERIHQAVTTLWRGLGLTLVQQPPPAPSARSVPPQHSSPNPAIPPTPVAPPSVATWVGSTPGSNPNPAIPFTPMVPPSAATWSGSSPVVAQQAPSSGFTHRMEQTVSSMGSTVSFSILKPGHAPLMVGTSVFCFLVLTAGIWLLWPDAPQTSYEPTPTVTPMAAAARPTTANMTANQPTNIVQLTESSNPTSTVEVAPLAVASAKPSASANSELPPEATATVAKSHTPAKPTAMPTAQPSLVGTRTKVPSIFSQD